MQRSTFLRHHRPVPAVALLMLVYASTAKAADTYDGITLNIPSLAVGSATYTNVAVKVGKILSGPTGSAAYGTQDSYDPVTNQLTVQSVIYNQMTFHNVKVTISALDSIASVSGTDTYDGTYLNIPSVLLKGGPTYYGAEIKVGNILSPGGEMPKSGEDVYDPVTKQLTISAVQVGGHVYTNPVVTVGQLISVGKTANSAACYDPVYYTSGTVSDVFYQVSNSGTNVETLEEQNVVLPSTTFNGVQNAVPIQTTNLVNGMAHSTITEYFDIQSQFPTLLELGQSDGVSFDPGIGIFGRVNAGQSVVSSGTVEPAAVSYTATWTFLGFEDLTVPAGTFSGACKWSLVENLGSGVGGATTWYNRHGVMLQTVPGTGVELQMMPNSTFNGSPVGP